MKTFLAALLVVSGLFCACDHAPRTDAAQKAFQEAKTNAERGDATAEAIVGNCYHKGEGVEKNFTEAVKWWRKAAEQGHAGAQFSLGISFYKGRGVEKNFTEAVKWYRKAVEQGEAYAQYNLGLCYDFGEGVEKDTAEAVRWYRKAAEQNVAGAQFNLGNSLRDGTGAEKNLTEAVQWFRKAAEQDHASAQFNLGVCYYNGTGVEKNLTEAMKRFRKAAEQGEPNAQSALTSLQKNSIDTFARDGVTPEAGKKASQVQRTVQEEQAKAAERVHADEIKARQTRPAESTKRSEAAAEAKRAAVAKEKEFEDWKAKRKAEMQATALTLTPAQMKLRNKAVASWNNLAPDQREKLWRQEYQQFEAARKLKIASDIALTERQLAQWAEVEKNAPTYHWDPAKEAAYAAQQAAAASRTEISPMSQQAQAAATETTSQQTAAQDPAQTQAQTAQATPMANREQRSEVDLTNTDGIFTLPVRLNSVVTKTFVLDTGASMISISREVYNA